MKYRGNTDTRLRWPRTASAAVPVSGPVDIVGAGDACTSGIVSALCCGAGPEEAAFMGNLCSSITIQVIGTTGTASREQLRRRYGEISGEALSNPL
ncbi:MAG: PfkB family carbohydrate kinase, partial [Treponema sp.]|nr:PfkB family carbohydrate kinase [Treponema sp.]